MGKKLNNNDRGVVSLLVTLIFIIVIGLIVLGFSEVSRNQANQTLANQLNSSASYAALSGINEIQNKIINGNLSDNSGTCCPITTGNCPLSFASSNSSTITCYSYNKTPSSLIANLNTSQGKLIHILPTNPKGDTYFKLSFDFQTTNMIDDSKCIPGYNSSNNKHLPEFFTFSSLEYNQNCSPGLIRADLSPAPFNDDGNTLAAKSSTIFMSPKSDKASQLSTTAYPLHIYSSLPTSPSIVYGESFNTTPSHTTVTIHCTFFNNLCEWINLRSIYAPVTVKITANSFTTNASYTSDSFQDSQYQIDVTAKSQNVVKRYVAAVNSKSTPTQVPNFAIQTTKSICKLVGIGDPYGSVSLGNFSYVATTVPTTGSTDSTDCIFPY